MSSQWNKKQSEVQLYPLNIANANLEPAYSTQSTLETEFKRQMWSHIRKQFTLEKTNVTWAFLFVAKNKIEGQWPALNNNNNHKKMSKLIFWLLIIISTYQFCFFFRWKPCRFWEKQVSPSMIFFLCVEWIHTRFSSSSCQGFVLCSRAVRAFQVVNSAFISKRLLSGNQRIKSDTPLVLPRCKTCE